MKLANSLLATLAALLLTASAFAAGIDSLAVKDASAGVKEALTKGAEHAVSSLGKDNDFHRYSYPRC
jgi:hypothetical protein